VKFLIDAQLPLRLSNHVANAGHDSVHTSALPDGNRTSDRELSAIAGSQNRVLVTKDRDFRDSHLLLNVPRQLLMVATGNITNDDLVALFEANLSLIVEAFENTSLIEITQTSVVIHDAR
jgi:predicted nuclease of predicted toxin-antitoxin system